MNSFGEFYRSLTFGQHYLISAYVIFTGIMIIFSTSTYRYCGEYFITWKFDYKWKNAKVLGKLFIIIAAIAILPADIISFVIMSVINIFRGVSIFAFNKDVTIKKLFRGKSWRN